MVDLHSDQGDLTDRFGIARYEEGNLEMRALLTTGTARARNRFSRGETVTEGLPVAGTIPGARETVKFGLPL